MNSSESVAEPSVKASGTRRRNLLIATAAIVIAVVVTAALMIPPPPPPEEPELTASLQPDSTVLAAGRTVGLEVSAWIDGDLIPPSEYECEWHMSPYDIGTIQRWTGFSFPKSSTDSKINFTAGRNVVTGNVTCIVTYEGRTVAAMTNITVDPPELEAAITPLDTQVLVNRNTTFSLVVSNSLGDTNLSYTANWSVHGLNPSDYQLNNTTGKSVRLLPKTVADVTLSALVQSGAEALQCNSSVEVVEAPPRSVEYRWYDMFNVSFGNHWQTRLGGVPRPEVGYEWFTTTYPYLLQWPWAAGSYDTYGGMRVNITGRNLTEISMNDRPEFIPFLGPQRGGNAAIDWYMQYLTHDEIIARYPSIASMDDGWFVVLNGTVALDKQAAYSVLDLTEEGFNDFSGWWHAASSDKSAKYMNWMVEEAGPSRLDISTMYQWPLLIAHWNLNAEKVGEQIVLRYDFVSWGMEALMTRWLRDAFMPTEWWFEDMRFRARIGPCLSDIDIDTAVQYAVKASNSTQNGQPCWIWQGMLQDPVPFEWNPHIMNPSPYYEINERYLDMDKWVLPWDPMPGGLPITYTPGSFNLTTGELLRFEWPSEDLKFMTQPFMQNWTNFSAEMTFGYSEPNESDMPAGQFLLNQTSRNLEFVGPFDFWTWSRDQVAHSYLSDKWDLFGLLPYGLPYIEFWPVS